MLKYNLLLLPFFPVLVLAQSNPSKQFLKRATNTLYRSNKPIPYPDSLTSTRFDYYGPSAMNGPQYFLILKKDSTFTWDSWYGSDAYISSGKYSIYEDTLVIKGQLAATDSFELEYKQAKPSWPYYNKTYIHKKFKIISDSSTSHSIDSLLLVYESPSKPNKAEGIIVRTIDRYYEKKDIESLRKLIPLIKEKNMDHRLIILATLKIEKLEELLEQER